MRFKRVLKVLKNIVKRFYQEDCSDRAASLVYTTLLSLVPFGLVALSILSAVPWLQGLGAKMQSFIFANFVAGSAQSIVEHLQGFMERLPGLSKANIWALALVSLWTIYNVSSAFNAIWRVKHRRNIYKSFSIYILILLLTPLLMGLGFLVSSFLISLPWVNSIFQIPYLEKILLELIACVLSFSTFTLLNWILPTCKVPFYAAVIGGVLSDLLFESAKYAFTLYISYFPSYVLLYGALAILPIFLVWLYISWVIILLGAMIAHEVTVEFGP